MGNFYTNVTVKADRAAVVETLRARRRAAYTAAGPGGTVVVVDREADTQDVDTLASLALTLAAKHSAPALAVLNHDDDALLLALYDANGLVMEYGWSNGPAFEVPHTDRAAFVELVRRHFGTLRRAPSPAPAAGNAGLNLLLKAARLIFSHSVAIEIHQQLVEETGLPDLCVGAGFKYVAQGDAGGSTQLFERV